MTLRAIVTSCTEAAYRDGILPPWFPMPQAVESTLSLIDLGYLQLCSDGGDCYWLEVQYPALVAAARRSAS